MARHPHSPEHDRRALALFEHLADKPGDTKLRARLTRGEPDAVLTRLRALEASAIRAVGAIPTIIPGSADCDSISPPPERVGAFRLIERIGRGGMGDVWRGQRNDGLFDQQVAIKLINRQALNRAADAFDDERRFLARLEHPNIARLIDGGVTEDGLPWLAMEYFDGIPIDVACEPLKTADAVQLFIKATDAVQHAHGRLVAHADLKPSNILVDAGGRVKLLDFGISGLIGAGPRKGTGSGPLTRDFASPERLAGEGPSVADDVYALGKTLSLILDSRHDHELSAIATKAQQADPDDRYGSAAELIADLDRWRARLPVRAMHDGLAYRVGKFIDRHRVGVAATGAALIALSATSLIATSSYVRAESERSEATARFEDARGSARYVSVELLDRLAAQPGTLALRAEAATVAQHYLDRLAGSPAARSDMRIEAADGLYRLAAAQGRPGRPNLGEPEEAQANLARAAALIGTPETPAARLLAIRIRLDQARLEANVANDIPAALGTLRIASGLIAEGPTPPALVGQYFVELSATRQWNGDYPAAIAAAQRALRILPETGDRDDLLRRASAWDILAEATYYEHDEKAAVAPYRKALEVNRLAADAHPGDQIAQRLLARAQWALATTLLGNGSDAEALTLLDQSSVILHRIVAADTADADARRMLGITENARAQALAANNMLDRAIPIFAAGVAERKALWLQRPGETVRLRDYMKAVQGFGDMLADHGRVAEGCAQYREVGALIERIKARQVLTGLDTSDTLADLARRQGKLCAARA